MSDFMGCLAGGKVRRGDDFFTYDDGAITRRRCESLVPDPYDSGHMAAVSGGHLWPWWRAWVDPEHALVDALRKLDERATDLERQLSGLRADRDALCRSQDDPMSVFPGEVA